MKVLVVGAGLSGAVIAHQIAEFTDHQVVVIDQRSHIGGNCYTTLDAQTNIIEHVYGPHIFHTDDLKVWNFVKSLTAFEPYVNRVKTISNGKVFSLPINLHTINQFYGAKFEPDGARKFISDVAIVSKDAKNIDEPQNFEEQALCMIGEELYEAFFKQYTIKQWGMDPKNLPASILKRLPLRFDYNDNYFFHKYQGMPKYGYTPIFQKLLDKIDVRLNTKFDASMREEYDHIFFSGKIDEWFGYSDGELPYRTLDFVKEWHNTEDKLGTAVMNQGDKEVQYTRISEHKHFAPWQTNTRSTFTVKEFSRQATKEDIPYYPIRMSNDKEILSKYMEKAANEKNVTFVGRLGTYQYLDMDVTIKLALDVAAEYINVYLLSKM